MTRHARATAALRAFAASAAVELVVNGHCMRPLLPHGARVTIRGRRLYLPGDVVAFRREDGRILVHRVLGFVFGPRGVRLVAQGDHLSRADEPVALDQILGRVVACDGRAIAVSPRQRLGSLLRYLRVVWRRSTRTWASAPSS